MAIEMKGMIDAVRSLTGVSPDMEKSLEGGGKLPKGVAEAFEQQMSMARNLFSENGGNSSGAAAFETGMINDSMMYDALAVISRIMQQGDATHGPVAVSPAMVNSVATAAAAAPRHAVKESSAVDPLTARPGVDGTLSARFESGNDGSAAIGWDSTGGTSYGKYQIASKTGTMDRFLNYLDDKAPDIAERLRSSGPADTGSRVGAMPQTWKSIAAQQPDRFEKLQHGFIKNEHYDAARKQIMNQTGIDVDNAPPVVREVLWSTSVQHGATGAANIFSKAINTFLGRTQGSDFSKKLIETVYDSRKGQFGSSTKRVQQAVGNRLESEKEIALNMLTSMQVNRVV